MEDTETMREMEKLKAIADAARDFMFEPENAEGYQDLLTSNSAAIPPEFMKLGELVFDYYGEPPKG